MTSPPETRTHKDAVHALLAAIPNLVAFDHEVDDDQLTVDADGRVEPYCVLYVGGGRRAFSNLTHVSHDLDLAFQVTCVGGDPDECLWAVDKVCAALVDTQLTVAGRLVWRIRQEFEPSSPRPDYAVRPPRFYQPLLFRLYSQPV